MQRLYNFFRQFLKVSKNFKPFNVADEEEFKPWWGTFSIDPGQTRFWKVGKIVITLNRFVNEWHIAHCSTEIFESAQKKALNKAKDSNQGEDKESEQSSVNSLDIFQSLNFKTFTFKTQAEITLNPVLADRPLASNLETPLHIPGGEEVLLYVSSPVWVRVETGRPPFVLDEIATYLLSDTWFGSDTMDGVLCYAAQTYCSPRLEELPRGTDRIISPMLIRNYSRSVFTLQKVSVPLPYLSVYTDPHNLLWTEQLNVYRQGDEYPEVTVAKGITKEVKHLKRITRARTYMKTSSWKNIFSTFTGGQ